MLWSISQEFFFDVLFLKEYTGESDKKIKSKEFVN